MGDIDRICDKLIATMSGVKGYERLLDLLRDFAAAAKSETETLRSDHVIFEVWPRFVATGEVVDNFRPELPEPLSEDAAAEMKDSLALIRDGRALLTYVASARVPMPKSTRQFLDRCDSFRQKHERRVAAA